jgi:hypothetical protein
MYLATWKQKGFMMRIRTMAGLALAGGIFGVAVVAGVAYATADESEPTLRIVTQEEGAAQPAQSTEDCPETATPNAEGTGL